MCSHLLAPAWFGKQWTYLPLTQLDRATLFLLCGLSACAGYIMGLSHSKRSLIIRVLAQLRRERQGSQVWWIPLRIWRYIQVAHRLNKVGWWWWRRKIRLRFWWWLKKLSSKHPSPKRWNKVKRWWINSCKGPNYNKSYPHIALFPAPPLIQNSLVGVKNTVRLITSTIVDQLQDPITMDKFFFLYGVRIFL